MTPLMDCTIFEKRYLRSILLIFNWKTPTPTKFGDLPAAHQLD